MSKRSILLLSLWGWVSAAGAGVISINVGDIELQPNTPNQVREIWVSSDDEPVQGVNFYIRIGTPDVSSSTEILPGVPRISRISDTTGEPELPVDIVSSSTIFGAHNTGQRFPLGTPDGLPYFEYCETTTDSGTVAANGLLALVTFDTTGIFATSTLQSWELSLSLPTDPPVPTDFSGVPATITNGSIYIAPVPEPATVAMLGGIIGCGAVVLWRRCRRRSAKVTDPESLPNDYSDQYSDDYSYKRPY